ncbi:erythrocyte membrane protein 1, PfEMP1, putative [Plasmodium gaboni]|uniref:Erythrocyte membrane protein 1, PfEMP1, putative n=1 Tax=Plasmodium gaboni TaxID=647221 RepID=A0ABY1UKZ2_9APIC|nr:erythrocyte membrane protein 1, PfEMP1, putative [Plasmodium gaboni]
MGNETSTAGGESLQKYMSILPRGAESWLHWNYINYLRNSIQKGQPWNDQKFLNLLLQEFKQVPDNNQEKFCKWKEIQKEIFNAVMKNHNHIQYTWEDNAEGILNDNVTIKLLNEKGCDKSVDKLENADSTSGSCNFNTVDLSTCLPVRRTNINLDGIISNITDMESIMTSGYSSEMKANLMFGIMANSLGAITRTEIENLKKKGRTDAEICKTMQRNFADYRDLFDGKDIVSYKKSRKLQCKLKHLQENIQNGRIIPINYSNLWNTFIKKTIDESLKDIKNEFGTKCELYNTSQTLFQCVRFLEEWFEEFLKKKQNMQNHIIHTCFNKNIKKITLQGGTNSEMGCNDYCNLYIEFLRNNKYCYDRYLKNCRDNIIKSVNKDKYGQNQNVKRYDESNAKAEIDSMLRKINQKVKRGNSIFGSTHQTDLSPFFEQNNSSFIDKAYICGCESNGGKGKDNINYYNVYNTDGSLNKLETLLKELSLCSMNDDDLDGTIGGKGEKVITKGRDGMKDMCDVSHVDSFIRNSNIGNPCSKNYNNNYVYICDGISRGSRGLLSEWKDKACLPPRTQKLCLGFLCNNKNTYYNDASVIDNNEKLLTELVYAAKIEGENIKNTYKRMTDTEMKKLCNSLKYSFADLGDMIRGRSIWENGYTQNMENNLRKIFHNIYNKLPSEKKSLYNDTNGTPDRSYYYLREVWWNSNREYIWKALLCGAKIKNNCGGYTAPNIDYMPQFLRWLTEWSGHFCEEKREYDEDTGKGEDSKHIISMCNGCYSEGGRDCLSSYPQRGYVSSNPTCSKCRRTCENYTEWIKNQKNEYDKQKNKYEEEIIKSKNGNTLRGKTSYRGPPIPHNTKNVTEFFKKIENMYPLANQFLHDRFKENGCDQNVDTINFEIGHNTFNLKHKYCKRCDEQKHLQILTKGKILPGGIEGSPPGYSQNGEDIKTTLTKNTHEPTYVTSNTQANIPNKPFQSGNNSTSSTCEEIIIRELKDGNNDLKLCAPKDKNLLDGTVNRSGQFILGNVGNSFVKITDDLILSNIYNGYSFIKKGSLSPCKNNSINYKKWICGKNGNNNEYIPKEDNVCLPPRTQVLCVGNLNADTTTTAKVRKPNINNVDNTQKLLTEVLIAAKYEGQNLKNNYKKYNNNEETLCSKVKYSFGDLADIIKGRNIYTISDKDKTEDNLVTIFKKIYEKLGSEKNKYTNGGKEDLKKLREAWWNTNREYVWKALAEGAAPTDTPKCLKEFEHTPPDIDYIPQFVRWMTEWSEEFCNERKEEVKKIEKECIECKNFTDCAKNGDNCKNCKEACSNYENQFIDKNNKKWETQWREQKKLFEEKIKSAEGTTNSGRFINNYCNCIDPSDEKNFFKYLKDHGPQTAEQYIDKVLLSSQNICGSDNSTFSGASSQVFSTKPKGYEYACECERTPKNDEEKCKYRGFRNDWDCSGSAGGENMCVNKGDGDDDENKASSEAQHGKSSGTNDTDMFYELFNEWLHDMEQMLGTSKTLVETACGKHTRGGGGATSGGHDCKECKELCECYDKFKSQIDEQWKKQEEYFGKYKRTLQEEMGFTDLIMYLDALCIMNEGIKSKNANSVQAEYDEYEKKCKERKGDKNNYVDALIKKSGEDKSKICDVCKEDKQQTSKVDDCKDINDVNACQTKNYDELKEPTKNNHELNKEWLCKSDNKQNINEKVCVPPRTQPLCIANMYQSGNKSKLLLTDSEDDLKKKLKAAIKKETELLYTYYTTTKNKNGTTSPTPGTPQGQVSPGFCDAAYRSFNDFKNLVTGEILWKPQSIGSVDTQIGEIIQKSGISRDQWWKKHQVEFWKAVQCGIKKGGGKGNECPKIQYDEDYDSQFYWWFREWGDDFCSKKKEKAKVVADKCKDESKRKCSNGASGNVMENGECKTACEDYAKLISKHKTAWKKFSEYFSEKEEKKNNNSSYNNYTEYLLTNCPDCSGTNFEKVFKDGNDHGDYQNTCTCQPSGQIEKTEEINPCNNDITTSNCREKNNNNQWNTSMIKDPNKFKVYSPPRRQKLCLGNLYGLTGGETPILALENELYAAAKKEAELLRELHNSDTKKACTAIKRSFYDFGDLIKGTDLQKGWYDNMVERELNEIFKKDENGSTPLTEDEIKEKREEWWKEKTDKVWKAMNCNGTSNPCRTASTTKPTEYDHHNQFLRWFIEWGEEFCKTKKQHIEKLKTICMRPDCNNKCNGATCEECQKQCAIYNNWLLDKKIEWNGQKEKYKEDYKQKPQNHDKYTDTNKKPDQYLKQYTTVCSTVDFKKVFKKKDNDYKDFKVKCANCTKELMKNIVKQIQSLNSGAGPQEIQPSNGTSKTTQKDACTIAEEVLKTKSSSNGRIGQCKPKTEGSIYPGWDCEGNKFIGGEGPCMPPRTQKLCFYYLGHKSETPKITTSEKLREAFIKCAAAEMFFAWKYYKDHGDGKNSSAEQKLKEGTIPDDFLRTMMYTLGDFRDLCLNTDISKKVERTNGYVTRATNKITELFSKNGGKNENGQTKEEWWKQNQEDIWNAMVCSLSYDDKKKEMDESTRDKLKNQNQYNNVKFNPNDNNSGLASFASRPQFLRWLTEWAEHYCKTQHKHYMDVKNACENCSVTPASGTGPKTCDKDKCKECHQACTKYKTEVTRWKGEWDKQSGKYDKLYDKAKQNGGGTTTDEVVKYLSKHASDTTYSTAGKYLKKEGYTSGCEKQTDFDKNGTSGSNNYAFEQYPDKYKDRCTCDNKPVATKTQDGGQPGTVGSPGTRGRSAHQTPPAKPDSVDLGTQLHYQPINHGGGQGTVDVKFGPDPSSTAQPSTPSSDPHAGSAGGDSGSAASGQGPPGGSGSSGPDPLASQITTVDPQGGSGIGAGIEPTVNSVVSIINDPNSKSNSGNSNQGRNANTISAQYEHYDLKDIQFDLPYGVDSNGHPPAHKGKTSDRPGTHSTSYIKKNIFPMNCMEKIANELQQKEEIEINNIRTKLKGSDSQNIYRTETNETFGKQTTCTINDNEHEFKNVKEHPCKNKGNPFDEGKEKWDCKNRNIIEQNICIPPRRKHMCTRNLETFLYKDITTTNELLKDVLLTATYEGKNLKENWLHAHKSRTSNICDHMKYSFADLADIIKGSDLMIQRKRDKIQQRLQNTFLHIFNSLDQGGQNEYNNDFPYFYKLRESWWNANRKNVWKAMTCAAPHEYNVFKKKEDESIHIIHNCGHNDEPPLDDYIPQRLRWMTEWSEHFCRRQKDEIQKLKDKCHECTNGNSCTNDGENGTKCKICKDKCKSYSEFIDKWKEQLNIQSKKYNELYEKANPSGSTSSDDHVTQFLKQVKKECDNDAKTAEQYLDKTANCTKIKFTPNDGSYSGNRAYAFKTPPEDYEKACKCTAPNPLDKCPKDNDTYDKVCKSLSGTKSCERKTFSNDPEEWNSKIVRANSGKNKGVLMPPRRKELCTKSLTQKTYNNGQKEEFKKDLLTAAYNEGNLLGKKYKDQSMEALQAMKYSFYDYGDIIKGTDMMKRTTSISIKTKLEKLLNNIQSNAQSSSTTSEPKNVSEWWDRNKTHLWHSMLCGYKNANQNEKLDEKWCSLPNEDETPQFLRWIKEWGREVCKQKQIMNDNVKSKCFPTGQTLQKETFKDTVGCRYAITEFEQWNTNTKTSLNELNTKYEKHKETKNNNSSNEKNVQEYITSKCSECKCSLMDVENIYKLSKYGEDTSKDILQRASVPEETKIFRETSPFLKLLTKIIHITVDSTNNIMNIGTSIGPRILDTAKELLTPPQLSSYKDIPKISGDSTKIIPEKINVEKYIIPATVFTFFGFISLLLYKKKPKLPTTKLFRVLDIPQNDYNIPRNESTNRYVPYSQYKGKTYIYVENDTDDDKYMFTSDTTDVTSSSESEYEEMDINDIYPYKSPKYKTLIDVVLRPSKSTHGTHDDTTHTQNVPPSDIPINKLTDNEWNELKDDFISNMLQTDKMDISRENLSGNIYMDNPPHTVDSSMEEKPFITQIQDRFLDNSREEVIYNIDWNIPKQNDITSNTMDDDPKYISNNIYTGIDLINDSLNLIFMMNCSKEKKMNYMEQNITKNTTFNNVATQKYDDLISNQKYLFHKWLDRHRDMCEKCSNKDELLDKLNEEWNNENKEHLLYTSTIHDINKINDENYNMISTNTHDGNDKISLEHLGSTNISYNDLITHNNSFETKNLRTNISMDIFMDENNVLTTNVTNEEDHLENSYNF